MIIRDVRRSNEEIYLDRERINEEIKTINKEIKRIKKLDFIELEPKDKKVYESLKELSVEFPILCKDEKDYLIRKKEINKDLKNSLLVQLVCEEKGHLLEEGRVINGSYFQGYCKRCRMAYQGGLTQKERNSSDRLMHTPMTI